MHSSHAKIKTIINTAVDRTISLAKDKRYQYYFKLLYKLMLTLLHYNNHGKMCITRFTTYCQLKKSLISNRY